jgi:chromosome segregation ATPase
MQDKYSESDSSDNERTDELPALSEAAVLAAGGRLPPFDDVLDDEDTGEYRMDLGGPHEPIDASQSRDTSQPRVTLRSRDTLRSHDAVAAAMLQEALSAIQKELAESRSAQADLVASLEQRDRQLAALQDDFDRQRQQIAELRAALKQSQQRYTALQDQLAAARMEITRQQQLAAASAEAADRTQPYRDEIQSLTAYITGRRERWDEMEILVNSQNERIADLQRELEQRIARQQALEQAARDEAARADSLKVKLAETGAALRDRDRELSILKRAKAGERARSGAGEATGKFTQLQRQVEEREKQLQAANEARERLERRLVETEANLARMRNDFSGLEKRLLEKDHAVGRQDERLAALQQELSERLSSLRRFDDNAAKAQAVGGAARRTPAADGSGATSQFPVLVCLTSESPERHVIADPEITIGRGPECAIRIPTHFVSREHARLRRDKGKVTIEDCGSTNGVFVNSVRIDRRELEHGDWVTIGETQFRFLREGAA